MASTIEYRNEQFIQQYEHIKKLELLTDEELSIVKRKRTFFEISIRNSSEIRPFINYIKFEMALMGKFRHYDFKDENDGRALDNAIAYHIKDLFKLTLKRFQSKRKVWEHYLSFLKQRFPNGASAVYREMLRYHHKAEDYIEAAQHESLKENYNAAMNLLVQGMGDQKESSAKLVVIYIECSFKQGDNEDEDAKKATLLQAAKFYEKFLKSSNEATTICELLRKIQKFDYSVSFQNDVIKHLLEEFSDRAEIWELLAARHLDGLIYVEPNDEAVEKSEDKEQKKIPFDACLRRAIEIYEKSFEAVAETEIQQMYTFFIDKLLELDESTAINDTCMKLIRQSLGKALSDGYKQDKLSEKHFICLLKLRSIQMDKYRNDVQEMLSKARHLYPQSLELCELGFRFYLQAKDFEKITEIFNTAVTNSEQPAIELYRCLCGIYLQNTDGREKALSAMLEAV